MWDGGREEFRYGGLIRVDYYWKLGYLFCSSSLEGGGGGAYLALSRGTAGAVGERAFDDDILLLGWKTRGELSFKRP